MPAKPATSTGVQTHFAEVAGSMLEFASVDGDLWFTHRSLARLLQSTTQNVVQHLKDLRLTGTPLSQRGITIAKVEGSRSVRRSMQHVNLETAMAVCLRARRFAEHRSLLMLGASHDIQVSEVRINSVKERDFAQLLEGTLAGITTVWRQHRIGRYRVDFFLPELGLAVEFDELHHQSPSRADADARRQSEISQRVGIEFLRVRQGADVEGLNSVVRKLVDSLKKR
jgi:very-short-patch-repair endonuclease